MKRTHLLQALNEMGAVFVRHGKKHDVYPRQTHELEFYLAENAKRQRRGGSI